MPQIFTKLLKSPARSSTKESLEIIKDRILPLVVKVFAISDGDV